MAFKILAELFEGAETSSLKTIVFKVILVLTILWLFQVEIWEIECWRWTRCNLRMRMVALISAQFQLASSHGILEACP